MKRKITTELLKDIEKNMFEDKKVRQRLKSICVICAALPIFQMVDQLIRYLLWSTKPR